MYKYKYTGGYPGTMSFIADGKGYDVSNSHPLLPIEVELENKIDVPGMELVEEKQDKKTKKTNKGVHE